MGAVNSTEAQLAVAAQNNMTLEAVLSAPHNTFLVITPLCSKYAGRYATQSASHTDVASVAAQTVIYFACAFGIHSIYHVFCRVKKLRGDWTRLAIGISITWALLLLVLDGVCIYRVRGAFIHSFYCEAMPDWSFYVTYKALYIAMLVIANPITWGLFWMLQMAVLLAWSACFDTPSALDTEYPPVRAFRILLTKFRCPWKVPPPLPNNYHMSNLAEA